MFEKVTGTLWYIKWFGIVCILALIMDMLWVFWPFPTMRGIAPFQETLLKESQLIAELSGSEGKTFIGLIQHWAYQPTFAWTGLHDMMRDAQRPESWAGANAFMHGFVTGNWEFLQTAHIGLLLFAQRLAVLALSAPLFLIAMFAAAIDGWLVRYKRRTSAGRESGFIYHHAKNAFNTTMLAVWVLYLLPPVVLDPRWVIPPALLILALATRLGVGYFKKYL